MALYTKVIDLSLVRPRGPARIRCTRPVYDVAGRAVLVLHGRNCCPGQQWVETDEPPLPALLGAQPLRRSRRSICFEHN